jgi:hypothetical protein
MYGKRRARTEDERLRALLIPSCIASTKLVPNGMHSPSMGRFRRRTQGRSPTTGVISKPRTLWNTPVFRRQLPAIAIEIEQKFNCIRPSSCHESDMLTAYR